MTALCGVGCTEAATGDTEEPVDTATTGTGGDSSGATETGASGTDAVPPTTSAEPPTGTDGDPSTGTGSTTETPDGTAAEPLCGDGVVDPGEECDEAGENADDGACTVSCVAAACGDGHIWTGHEECDDGNDDDDDACVAGCVAASCGDGYLFVGSEECEPGDIDDEYACGLECMWSPLVAAPRLVFLSSVLFYGDLSIHAPSLGDYAMADLPDGGKTGVLLADARCQALAVLGGLAQPGDPPTFHAWLSDNNGTELSSVVDRLHPNASPELQAGYMLPGGPMIATSFMALTQGLMAAINKDEQGAVVDGQPYVWSNTSDQGEALGLVDGMGKPTSCESWHAASLEHVGEFGFATQAPMVWTESGAAQFCSKALRLYCFQEG
ncbi:MAG: hypothetical protein KC636_30865 [Myxococcales bacterium]|nr:hypothetical protein [Myxococcales bacterium]